MKTLQSTNRPLGRLLLLLGWLLPLAVFAQQPVDTTSCDPNANAEISSSEVNFNYGATTNAFGFTTRSNLIVGQPFTGKVVNRENISEYGFYARLFLPPQPASLVATQGDFPNRVLLEWTPDPLSSEPTEGFVIRRDGAYLDQVDIDTRQYIDFNVQAGEFYEYSVIGRNRFGNGSPGKDVGFVNPNGVVTGKIETFSGNPVTRATVTLNPTVNKALAFDGEDDFVCVSYNLDKMPSASWTTSFWVKIDSTNDEAPLLDLGSDFNQNFWFTTHVAGGDNGINVYVGDGSGNKSLTATFEEEPDGWHQVTAVYTGGRILLYVDGMFRGSRLAPLEMAPKRFFVGTNQEQSAYFKGKLDELRIYDAPLTQTDILLTKDITISSRTPNIVAYWKADEGLGRKVFDITANNIDGELNGATFTGDAPVVLNAGMTDESGVYAIEGVNYSEVQTFQATASKNFYHHQSLEFNAALGAYADLTAFDLMKEASIEIAVQPFDLESRQTLLAQEDRFELFLENSIFKLMVNGTVKDLGPATDDYQYLTVQLDSTSGAVTYYRNGDLANSLDGYDLSGDFSSDPWRIAASTDATPGDFYTGLIDQVAVFDTIYDQAQVELHANPLAGENITSGVEAGDANLRAFFPIDEGRGTVIDDYGPNMTGAGTVHNASFSIVAYRQVTEPHVFRPSSRTVNLNTSNTAVGNIDFVDESTIQITGVVRFSNTFCYQDSVHILVNGFPASPRIYTDKDGRFVADFEPGVNVSLAPEYEADTTHLFVPGTFATKNLNRPIAGVLFQNKTKRSLRGIVAGNADCRKPINTEDPVTALQMQIRSLDGCFVKEMTIDNKEGFYQFRDLPPIPMTIGVKTFLGNPDIEEFFMQKGAATVDLRAVETDTVDFIYVSPPQVEMEDFDEVQLGQNCSIAYIDQSTPGNGYKGYKNNIRVYEDYGVVTEADMSGRCYLDTFKLTINNRIAELPPFDTIIADTTVFGYEFFAGPPNIGGDHLKLLEVTADVNESLATASKQVVVLGKRKRESTFTTASPAQPLLILRDPPGDESYAEIALGSSSCYTLSGQTMTSVSTGATEKFTTGDSKTVYAGSPVGGVVTELFDVEAGLEFSVEATVSAETENAVNVCSTMETVYQTSAGDDIIGEDADLYVGAAFNLEFAATDSLKVDTNVCDFVLPTGFEVFPGGIGTRYIYSEWQIETDVIPSLESIGEQRSADAWRSIIEMNHDLKRKAVQQENITFDGLTTVTETIGASEESSSSFSFGIEITEELTESLSLGGDAFPVGQEVSFSFGISAAVTATAEFSNERNRSVSYTLADDDPNDNFSIDVKMDGTFGTPVFDLRAGESMCPWEPETLNREEVGFTSDALTKVNVPMNDLAVFNLQMTNLGQTGNDPLIYILGLVEGSNPLGAAIIVDGEPLTDPRAYQILPGETLEILAGVQRGPEAFSYSDLGIFMASECMWEHSRNLGYDLANSKIEVDNGVVSDREGPFYRPDLEKFYQELRLNVEYIEPCSEVNLSAPLPGWVVTPNDGNLLVLNMFEYDAGDDDLKEIRLQYRPLDGDGIWTNIKTFRADTFLQHPTALAYQWDMEELVDGEYEVRAIAECTDVNLEPGISRVMQGRKETLPPTLFGTPEPADGVLSPGDEISITFSKRIRCDRIFQADGTGSNFNVNNLALIDATTNTLIDAEIACKGDKIIIIPNVPNQFIENRTLRVVVDNIEDLYGNRTKEIVWEFFVNRSNLYWAGGRIDEMTPEGQPLTVTRDIRNQGGAITSFTIDDIPSWMNVFPREGSLEPGTNKIITFQFPGDLPSDAYNTRLVMETIDGPEPLDIDLRVNCPAPPWSFDPARYTFSMNLTVELDVEGELSSDRVDQIGAFVNGELRGLANVEYVETLDQNGRNAYLAFLTVYSNEVSGETVEFQIWDASECVLYGSTLEEFPYVPDNIIGEPLEPQTIHTSGEVLKKIYLNPGWNWISCNLTTPNNFVQTFLSSLTNPGSGMIIKDQSSFSQFTPGPNLWLGSLFTTTYETMYQLRSNTTDSLTLIGSQVDPTTPIPVTRGWNWIGYLPGQSLTVNQALSSLSPLDGDVVKGQLAFAQYVAGTGWIGNLDFMSPTRGYLLRMSNADNLIYPEPGSGATRIGGRSRPAPTVVHSTNESHWTVRPQDFEHNMNMIVVVHDSLNDNVLSVGDEVGVLVDGEVRGADQVIYVAELDAHLIFLTVYANVDGEPLEFRFYDESTGEEHELTDGYNFVINQVIGEPNNPTPLHLNTVVTTSTTNTPGNTGFFELYPNPTMEGQSVYLKFSATPEQPVTITVTDALGRRVDRLELRNPLRENTLEWTPQRLPAGIYFVSLQRSAGVKTLRLEIR